jgi:branched-chain amino acid transport system substrate-binding protein
VTNFCRASSLAALALASISSAPLRAAEPHLLGVIAPTSGPVATVGLRQLKTIQWWEQEVNKSGGISGRPVKVVHCNDEAKPERAVSCTRDLLSQKVVLILNSSITGPIRATIPLLKNGPVMITPSPYIEPDPSSFVFQTSPTDRAITEALARYLKDSKATRLGMIAATDAGGEGSVESAKAVFPKWGIEANIARIDLRANDASAQLARVAETGVRAVYSAYTGGGAATVVKSYSNLGIKVPLIVSYANISDLFLGLVDKVLPPRLLGTALKVVDPELLGSDAERGRARFFATSYQAWAGERADSVNFFALALADTADAVLRNVPDASDPAAVRRYLQTTPIPSSQTLRFAADRNVGLTADDIAIVELKDGAWKRADPL